MGLVKALLLFILLVILLRVIDFFLRIRKTFKNAQSSARQNTKKEGQIDIKTPPHKNKKVDDSVGEYVNYEEID